MRDMDAGQWKIGLTLLLGASLAACGGTGGSLSVGKNAPNAKLAAAKSFSAGAAASVTATVNVPIFTGGLNSSQIRQAAEQDNVARIGIESARRQVALIGLGLHAGRLRQAPAQACESQLLHLAVSRQ